MARQRLGIVKRLRIQGEFFRKRREYIDAGGMTPEDAGNAALGDMHEKYGLDLDWAAILEFLMMILALFTDDGQPATPA